MPHLKATPRTVVEVRHALAEAQARELRHLIGAHVAAQVADSWKGGGDPLDAPVTEAAAALAQAELDAFIARLVREGK